ncbi:MAG: hypothetical protein WBX01_10740 [Nitrososphaeraceae archaeon]
MGNQSVVILGSMILLAILGLTQTTNYNLSGQQDDGISISDKPFYSATNGTIVGEKVIGISSEDPRIETSFIENAIVDNVGNISNIGTFVEHMISSDVIRGTGEGIITSHGSNSTIGWNAYDLGKRSDDGGFILKGTIFFHILSANDTDNEFMFVDNQVGVYKNIVNFDNVDYAGREIWFIN